MFSNFSENFSINLAGFLKKHAQFLKKLARFLNPGHRSCSPFLKSWIIIGNTNFIWKYSEIWTKIPALGPGLVLQKIPSLVQVLVSWAIDWAENERDRSNPWGVESATDGRTDIVRTIAYFFKVWKYAKNHHSVRERPHNT
jgi:hypothetical protein